MYYPVYYLIILIIHSSSCKVTSEMCGIVRLHHMYHTAAKSFPASSPVCICWQIRDIIQRIISQESWVEDTLKGKLKLQQKKDADKDRSSVSEITMQYLHAVHTAAEHCSLGTRGAAVYQLLAIWAKSHWNSSQRFSPPAPPSICECLCSSQTKTAQQTATRVQSKQLLRSRRQRIICL